MRFLVQQRAFVMTTVQLSVIRTRMTAGLRPKVLTTMEMSNVVFFYGLVDYTMSQPRSPQSRQLACIRQELGSSPSHVLAILRFVIFLTTP